MRTVNPFLLESTSGNGSPAAAPAPWGAAAPPLAACAAASAPRSSLSGGADVVAHVTLSSAAAHHAKGALAALPPPAVAPPRGSFEGSWPPSPPAVAAAPSSPGQQLPPGSPLASGYSSQRSSLGNASPPPMPRTWMPPRASGLGARLKAKDALQQELREMGSAAGGGGSGDAAGAFGGALEGAAPLMSPHGRRRSSASGACAGAPAAPFAGAAAAPVAVRNNLCGDGGGGGGGASGGEPGPLAAGRASGSGVVALLRDRMSAGPAPAGAGGASPAVATTSVQAFRPGDAAAAPRTGAAAPPPRRGGAEPGGRAGGAGAGGGAPRGLAGQLGQQSPAQWAAEVEGLIAAGCHQQAALLAGPATGTVKCYIRLTKGFLGTGASYELRLEATDRLLLAAAPRAKSKCSSFLIATRPGAAPGSDGAVAKLKANLMGSEYVAWQKGGGPAAHKGYGAQALAVRYHPASSSPSGGARQMSAMVPAPGEPLWLPPGGDSSASDALGPLLGRADARELAPALERRVVLLHNMSPFFDEAKGVHYLDFRGRVTKASTKNFQLVHWDHNSGSLGRELVLQFGKRGGGEYALDFAWPLSALQAFALALTSFDSKLCYAI
ncbi:MAG: tubby C-terminal-like domain-containing protein [Monoraphidium minutum]|nr:MAG: tubby C-terminal-like domain-containing protein [Monoraphidium minutum]